MTDQTLDRVFSTLGDSRRRLVCRHLARADEHVVSVGELSAFVADARTERSSATSDDRRSRIATRLYHVHLPALDDAGIVDYDAKNESVAVDSAFPIAVDLLRSVDDRPERPDGVPTID
ncbi:hypothetical protein HTZ84_07810 [Haloterrigena sp. SYSU A558-1]|uniref:DUF7344 domain-containing protein n=1 Tax=Haloterrigena gelatinilytica TaxID=2741724 RepID=A0A8J8GP97_9EURY|nr:hypothetical protein [Haloterrigena gelatinilytica]NUB91959.1 hypothetical protein [Haloterrigena gelatinilytica]NUC72215.1 hypothetical protein [Haloterrigena gelatinilytica]